MFLFAQEDCEDSKFEWQHVLRLPFIDARVVLGAAAIADASLTAAEVTRNTNTDVSCIRREDGAVVVALVPNPAVAAYVNNCDPTPAMTERGTLNMHHACWLGLQAVSLLLCLLTSEYGPVARGSVHSSRGFDSTRLVRVVGSLHTPAWSHHLCSVC